MSRPETIEDLPRNVLDPVVIATAEVNLIFQFSNAEASSHAAALLECCERTGLIVDRGTGEISRPRTADELATDLAAAQNTWDYWNGKFQEAKKDPLSVESDVRGFVDRWAKSQGLEPINWVVAA